MQTISRRRFMHWSMALSALALSAWNRQVLAALQNADTLQTFAYGIASGDPTATSVVLWTRLNVESSRAKESLNWVVAADSGFATIIKQGRVDTNAARDFTVKLNVDGLVPGRSYYYRFEYNGVVSEPGRTRTLPVGAIDNVCMAVVSCSNYPFGYFNAYEAIANDSSVQFVLHLGDYIYEYGVDGYGGETGRQLNRNHSPAHEIVSLDDYRQRHAQYKADPASRLMHAAHPLIAIWDDHESTNNPYMTGAQNHQPDEGEWLARRNNSLQAYFEWMPVRDPAPSTQPEQYWRAFEFGDLASLITLETRHTGRSKQIDYGEHLAAITSPAARQRFVEDVLGSAERAMLSEQMQQFYRQQMAVAKTKTWRLIGNQIPMARTHVPDIGELIASLQLAPDHPLAAEVAAFKRLGELDLPIYTDTWDGYPAARENFYAMTRALGVSDLLVLTGDSHSFWFNQLFDALGAPVGLELGTAGVTSPGDFEAFGAEVAAAIDRKLQAHNREIIWVDGLHKGYLRLAIDADTATANYLSVSDILSSDYELSLLKQVVIRRNDGQLTYKLG